MKKTLLTVGLLFLCCWFCGYGQTPDWVWARGAKPSTSEGTSVATDSIENVFFAGVAYGAVNFDTIALSGYEYTCLAKYDSSGNLKWAKGSGNLGFSYGG